MSLGARLLVVLMPLLLANALPLHAAERADRACGGGEHPLVIGHRGASGYLPEHTLASYFVAIEQGADSIEPDLVMTKDGVLVVRHENEISATTDVADRPEFADRRATKTIDGLEVTGWFTEDFTLAELKTLRAKERVPQLRPAGARFDGMFDIPTLAEVLALVEAVNAARAREASAAGQEAPRPIGVYPETKHPTYFAGIGLPLEAPLLDLLQQYGYAGPSAPVVIQSFEVGNLKSLAEQTSLPLVQLLNASGQPYDLAAAGDSRTYADLAQPSGLAEIATYACGIGVPKEIVIPLAADGSLGAETVLVNAAHAAGLAVHVFTFRAENYFLPTDLRSGDDPTALGDLASELGTFLASGIDGFFTDQPDIGVIARDEMSGDG